MTQAARRGARRPPRCAQEPRPRGQHDRPLHRRSRLPLQDAHRRIQVILPRSLHPRADRPWGPGFDGGGWVRELVSLIDLPPTLLDGEMFIRIGENPVGCAVRTKRWKYGVIAPEKHGGRDAGSDRCNEEYLYDLQADPHELTNSIGFPSHEEVAAVLRERLFHHVVAAGETPRRSRLRPSRAPPASAASAPRRHRLDDVQAAAVANPRIDGRRPCLR